MSEELNTAGCECAVCTEFECRSPDSPPMNRMFIDTPVPDHIPPTWLEHFEDIYWAIEFAVRERKHAAGQIKCEFDEVVCEGILYIENDIKVFLLNDMEVVYMYRHYGEDRCVRGLTPDQFSKIIE